MAHLCNNWTACVLLFPDSKFRGLFNASFILVLIKAETSRARFPKAHATLAEPFYMAVEMTSLYYRPATHLLLPTFHLIADKAVRHAGKETIPFPWERAYWRPASQLRHSLSLRHWSLKASTLSSVKEMKICTSLKLLWGSML